MEIIIGAVLSVLMQIVKKLNAKIGVETTKSVVYITLFIAVTVATYVVRANLISQESVQFGLTVLSSSVATYELVLKRLSLFSKLK